jgi:hypothetical protein
VHLREVPAVTGDELLQAVADAAREAVLDRYEPDSCIATTRVVIETARYFSVSMRPWAVNLRVFNPAGWACAEAGTPAADWPEDAWAMSMSAATGEQVGHVVAVTAAGDRMVDASIDQVARPGLGVPAFRPLVCGLPPGWDAPGACIMWQAEGHHLVYTSSGSRVFATQSPNWRRGDPGNRACTADAIRAVRALVAA